MGEGAARVDWLNVDDPQSLRIVDGRWTLSPSHIGRGDCGAEPSFNGKGELARLAFTCEWKCSPGDPCHGGAEYEFIRDPLSTCGADMGRLPFRTISKALTCSALGLAAASVPVSAKSTSAYQPRADVKQSTAMRDRLRAAVCGDTATVRRHNGESATAFLMRVRPAAMELSHRALEGEFGFTSRDILALFGTRSAGLLHGWVLTPIAGCPGFYRRHVLPIDEISLWEVASPAYEVRAALRANADRDAARELVLILRAEGRGPADDRGNRDWNVENNVAVFDWNGTRFVILDPVSERLYGLRAAAAVRARLRNLGY